MICWKNREVILMFGSFVASITISNRSPGEEVSLSII